MFRGYKESKPWFFVQLSTGFIFDLSATNLDYPEFWNHTEPCNHYLSFNGENMKFYIDYPFS
jgi:hypothetical protein